MDSEYLETYAWTCAHANDLDQVIDLCGFWFLCNCGN